MVWRLLRILGMGCTSERGRLPILWLAFGAVVLVACGGSVEPLELDAGMATCTPGRFISCAGPSGCSSYQTCNADGSAYGPCTCAASTGGEEDASTDASLSVTEGGAAGDAGASCSATCTTPAGAVQPFTAVEEVYQALVGRWQVCGGGLGAFAGAPADVIGVEYGRPSLEASTSGDNGGGNMYYLVQGPTGPVRGQGFAYELTYDVSTAGLASPEGMVLLQLYMHPTPNSGFGGSFRYSPCPTEFWVQGSSQVGGAVLVPFY
jgi:hypothetical protein